MNISSNLSSIQAHQTLLGNSAHNVANVNTDRFVPGEGTIGEGAGNTVEARITEGTDNGSAGSQTDLSREVTDQIVFERGIEANVASIRTQDQMYGSLLDITV
jgi:flagellar hook protein FlgE